MKALSMHYRFLAVVVMFLFVPVLYGMQGLFVDGELCDPIIVALGLRMKNRERSAFTCASKKCNTVMSREFPSYKKSLQSDPVLLYTLHLQLVNAIEAEARGNNRHKFAEPFFKSGTIINYYFDKCIEIAQDTGLPSLPRLVAIFFKQAFTVLRIIEEYSNVFIIYEDESAVNRYLNNGQSNPFSFEKNNTIERFPTQSNTGNGADKQFSVVKKNKTLDVRSTIRLALERSNRGDFGPTLVISPLIDETNIPFGCQKTIKIEPCSNDILFKKDITSAVLEAIKNDELVFALWLIKKSVPGSFSGTKCIKIAACTGDVDLVLKVTQFGAMIKSGR